ncbi:MAG: DNA-processing protein DprA, partial [Gemmatimonadaceae bacterium]
MFPDYSGRRIGKADPEYPAALNKLNDAPKAIWIAGALATAAAPAVAIVGTRHASAYGLRTARTLAATCARAGVCVVSGLASGIDGAAHEGALEAGGRTVGVLGTSLDVAFPKQHRNLQQQVAREGLLVTEMESGQGANVWTFPRRNRLIAAFSQLVVVVEAGTKSGAQITVEHAHTLNIPVAAVPGMMDAP